MLMVFGKLIWSGN